MYKSLLAQLGVILIGLGFFASFYYFGYWGNGNTKKWVEFRNIEWREDKFLVTAINFNGSDYIRYDFTINSDGTDLSHLKGEYQSVQSVGYLRSRADIPNSPYKFRRDCGDMCIRVFRKSDDKFLFKIDRDDLDIAAKGGSIVGIPTHKIVYILIIVAMVGGGLLTFPFAYTHRLLWLALIIYAVYLFFVYRYLSWMLGHI